MNWQITTPCDFAQGAVKLDFWVLRGVGVGGTSQTRQRKLELDQQRANIWTEADHSIAKPSPKFGEGKEWHHGILSHQIHHTLTHPLLHSPLLHLPPLLLPKLSLHILANPPQVPLHPKQRHRPHLLINPTNPTVPALRLLPPPLHLPRFRRNPQLLLTPLLPLPWNPFPLHPFPFPRRPPPFLHPSYHRAKSLLRGSDPPRHPPQFVSFHGRCYPARTR